MCGYIRSKVAEDFFRQENSGLGDVRINVAAAEKHRCSFHRPWIVSHCTVRTNETTTEANNAAVFSRVTRCKLQCKTCTLREAQKHNTFGWNASFIRLPKNR